MTERGLLRPARLVAACILGSRILGMVRDIICAYYFGASLIWDAFVIAFIIPNLFRTLFGEGALTAAFIPVFVERLDKQGRESAGRLLRALLGVVSMVLVTLILLGMGLTILLPALSDSEKVRQTCSMIQGLLPYLYLICTAAILGAALNSMGHFFAPAFAGVVLNAVWITAMLLFGPDIWVIIFAILFAGVLQLGMQVPPLLKRGIVPLPRLDRKEEGLKEVSLLFLPVVFGLALVQINFLVDNLIAEWCIPGDGAVSILYYGNRITQLPTALIGIALATAALPKLSGHAASQDTAAFQEALIKTLRTAIFVAVPAAVGLVLLSTPMVQVIFEHGRFGPEETKRTSLVLAICAIGLTTFCLLHILVRAFHARKEVRVPVRVGAFMVFANLTLNLILVWPFREAGLVAASVVTSTASLCILYLLLRRRLPELHVGIPLLLLKTIFFSAVMAAAVLGAQALLIHLLPDDTIPQHKIIQAVRLAAVIGIGATVYFGVAALFRTTWRSVISRS